MNTEEQLLDLVRNRYNDRLNSLESKVKEFEEWKAKLGQSAKARHVTRENACEQLKCKFTKLHQLINDNHLKTIHSGRRTLITQESIDRYLASIAARGKADS